MAGTRTAPAVTGAITGSTLSMNLVDASGDPHTVSYKRPGATAITAAQAEAAAAAYQAVTQASIYNIDLTQHWEGAYAVANATADQRSSVKDGINNLFRNVTLDRASSLRLVAPTTAVMVGNSDVIQPVEADMSALLTAWIAVLVAPYAFVSAQYTERTERKGNPKAKSIASS